MTALIISLIIIGIILIVAEFLIIPGFGIAGILGFIAMISSCYLGFAYFSTSTGIIVSLINLVLLAIVTIFALRSKTWKKLSLNTNIDSKVDSSPSSKGIVIGLRGKTLTRLSPGGDVLFNGVVTEVFSRDRLIDPNKDVIVCDIEANKIYVNEI